MATPGYRPQLRDRPSDQSKRRVGTTTDSFGGNVGRALQGFGDDMREAANVFETIKRENSATVAREGSVDFSYEAREITHGPDGYFAQTGTRALGDSRQSYADALRDAQQRVMEGIEDPQAREQFRLSSEERISELSDRAALHETEQSRTAAISSRESMRLAAEENALTFWDDDEAFEDALAEAVAHSDSLGEFVGTDEETQELAREQLVSNVLRSRAILMADKDPEQAMDLIENDDRLTEQHRKELRDNLQPLVLQHRADQLVVRHTTTVDIPNQPFIETLIQRESGGDPMARNPGEGQSASGLLQFTDGTWDNFMGQLRDSGRVPAGYDLSTMSTTEIRNLRFNEDFVRATAQDWVANLDRTLDDIGVPNTDGNRYLVHHMGAGGASWLLKARPGQTAREVYAANNKSWAAVVAANPNMFTENMTARQAAQAVKTYFGASSGLAPDTDGRTGFNAAAAMAEANRIEDPDERAAAISAIQTRNAEINAEELARSGQALDSATERYLETGTTELTLQEKLTLGATGMEAFRSYVASDRTNSLADNPVVVDDLLTMAMSQNRTTAKEFAAEGYLEQFRHQMSRPQYDTLLAQRRAVRTELEGKRLSEEALAANPELAVKVTDKMTSYAEKHLTALFGDMKDMDPQTAARYRLEFQRRLIDDLTQFQKDKRRQPANQAEWGPIIDAAMAETSFEIDPPGFGNKTNAPAFLAETMAEDGSEIALTTEYDDVPADERERISSLLLMVTGEVPTEDDVARAYTDVIQMRGNQPPTGMLPEEMPQSALRYLTSPPPSSGISPMTADEAALAWQQYVMGVLNGGIDPLEQPFIPEPMQGMSPTGVPLAGANLPLHAPQPNGTPVEQPRATDPLADAREQVRNQPQNSVPREGF